MRGVEWAGELRTGGQSVDLRGAGRTVVERMGLLPAARERAVSQRGIAWVDRSGSRLAAMPVEAFGGRGFVSSDELLRGDLVTLLHDSAGSEGAAGPTTWWWVPTGCTPPYDGCRSAPSRSSCGPWVCARLVHRAVPE